MRRLTYQRWFKLPYGGQPKSRRAREARIGSAYGRRARVEALEDRRMLAALTVGNNLDVVNGNTISITALISSPGPDGVLEEP